MKNIADFIQSGLLAMLGGQNEGLTLEDRNPNFRQGGHVPWGGGFDPLNGHENMLQKLPYIPSQQGSFGISPYEIDDLVDRPGQYLGPRESYVQLLSDKPQQAQGTLAGQEIPYYMLGERPLEGAEWMYGIAGNNDLRGRHQHFIKSDGSNFGFGPNGVFSEPQGKLGSYEYSVPGIGGKKIRGDLIDEARAIHEKQKEEIQEALNKANYQTDTSWQNADELPRYQYNFIGNNCQDYAGEIMEIAQKLARRRGVSLYLD